VQQAPFLTSNQLLIPNLYQYKVTTQHKLDKDKFRKYRHKLLFTPYTPLVNVVVPPPQSSPAE